MRITNILLAALAASLTPALTPPPTPTAPAPILQPTITAPPRLTARVHLTGLAGDPGTFPVTSNLYYNLCSAQLSSFMAHSPASPYEIRTWGRNAWFLTTLSLDPAGLAAACSEYYAPMPVSATLTEFTASQIAGYSARRIAWVQSVESEVEAVAATCGGMVSALARALLVTDAAGCTRAVTELVDAKIKTAGGGTGKGTGNGGVARETGCGVVAAAAAAVVGVVGVMAM